MFADEVGTDYHTHRKDLSRENIPDLRRILKVDSLDDDPEGIQELLALVKGSSIDWWGVLRNRVLVKLDQWRALFTVEEGTGQALVEFFPNTVYAFPPHGCPLAEMGFYFRFFVSVEELVGIHETLLDSKDLLISFAMIYHGQEPRDTAESEEIQGE